MSYIYIDTETGYFSQISDRSIENPELSLVDSLPPNGQCRWDGRNWIKLTPEEIAATEYKSMEVPWLKLDETQELIIDSQDIVDGKKVNVRHKSNVQPKRNAKGIYLDGNGYLAFPSLSWSRGSETKKIEIVFNWTGDRNCYLGLAATEIFNWEGTDRLSTEICYYLRGDHLYYCYGHSGGERLFAYTSYFQISKNKTYRFELENNGDVDSLAKLYRLDSDSPEHWDKPGLLRWQESVPLSIIGRGKEIMPCVLGANKAGSEVLAARVY